VNALPVAAMGAAGDALTVAPGLGDASAAPVPLPCWMVWPKSWIAAAIAGEK
jgi:hypothetical protein